MLPEGVFKRSMNNALMGTPQKCERMNMGGV